MDYHSKWNNSIKEVYECSWEIHYKGAECKFELTSDVDAVLYHLEVPKNMRNQGIGQSMIKFVESYTKNNTSAKTLFIQIGSPTGAAEHILKKLDYDITGIEERETLGKVIDAQKSIK